MRIRHVGDHAVVTCSGSAQTLFSSSIPLVSHLPPSPCLHQDAYSHRNISSGQSYHQPPGTTSPYSNRSPPEAARSTPSQPRSNPWPHVSSPRVLRTTKFLHSPRRHIHASLKIKATVSLPLFERSAVSRMTMPSVAGKLALLISPSGRNTTSTVRIGVICTAALS